MKNKYFALGLVAITAAVVLSGCTGPQQVPAQQPVTNGTVTDTTVTTPNQTTQQQTVAPQTTTQGSAISEDYAKLIAVNDAALTLDGVTFTKISHEFDDGIDKYEIEFYANQTEYDYDIDANTGNILSSSKEFNQALPATQPVQQPDATNPTQTQPAQQQQTGQQQQQQQPAQPQQSGQQVQTTITQEQALDIAIKAANVSANDISFSRCKLDFEDDYGKYVYDVEFHVGMTEYSYDIDPDTGNILSYDVDYDD